MTSRRNMVFRRAPGGIVRRWALPIILVVLSTVALAGSAWAINGTISPNSIEIDPSANLYLSASPPPNTVDWVKDSLTNTDTPTLINSIATGVNTTVGPNQTGAAAVGHWYGVRIVDGVGGNDQDIFAQGGKEDDTTTWHVQPGTVGSGKYDVTQAYLANNQETMFIGMEKRTNNGTTAFDFEFNQFAPADPDTNFYVPTRTTGDVVLTFELQGNGNTGSATAHYFRWNGTAYVEQSPPPGGLLTTINNTTIPAAPWGFVSDNGNWVTGNLARFQFAEARIALSALPGLSGCGGTAYVQVRSRSSSTPNSDLKDTTRIFEYTFGGPQAAATLSTNCSQQFLYDGSGSVDSQGGTNLTYSWVFTVPTGVTLSGGGVSVIDPTHYSASQVSGTVDVGLPVGAASTQIEGELTVTEGGTTCTSSVVANPSPVTVYRLLTVQATLTPDCDNTFGYSATASGGLAPYTFDWTIQKLVNGQWVTAHTFSDTPVGATSSGTLNINDSTWTVNGDGTYRALVTVTDANSCTANATSNTADIANPLDATATKTSANGTLLTVLLTGTPGDSFGTPTYQWQVEGPVGTWTNINGATSSTFTYSNFENDATATATSFSIGTDNYVGKLYSVNLRVVVSRTINGYQCSDNSAPVTVKKVIAVDP